MTLMTGGGQIELKDLRASPVAYLQGLAKYALSIGPEHTICVHEWSCHGGNNR